ncbi:M15 family metallopeptidase [Lysobacter cavernae]|uniref:D-alanyl-D-alanine dipeptidase n=1 Tax=Lysobacter cavernae TaxID=1685901 RepID=A0ABV7RRB9_9GAMM
MVTFVAILACVGCATRSEAPTVSAAPTAEAAGMVDIRSLVPDIDTDIRYAGSDNFVGAPVTGYEAPRCYLLHPVAQALQRVEQALREDGYRLRIYDCYRPVRAVRHFVAWAGDLDDQHTKPRYYPHIDKSALLGDYIAASSGHSRGATVDLTLLQCETGTTSCRPLDMGTDFDFFDATAHTDTPQVTPPQRENRQRLRAAMQAQGLRNYPLEWWHYTLRPEPAPTVAYDFPVR